MPPDMPARPAATDNPAAMAHTHFRAHAGLMPHAVAPDYTPSEKHRTLVAAPSGSSAAVVTPPLSKSDASAHAAHSVPDARGLSVPTRSPTAATIPIIDSTRP